MNQTWIYDVETYKYAFIVCFYNIHTKEKKHFEISFRKNQLKELIIFLKNECKGLIGFNILDFDYPIIHRILLNKLTTSEEIYYKANEIIQEQYSMINSKEILIPQLDLFRIWHFNNKSKYTSLKWLEFAFRFNNIEDLPYEIDSELTSEMIDNIISYCYHDIEATNKLYQYTKGVVDLDIFKSIYEGKDKIAFRKQMSQRFNTNFLNDNDVKIGEEINKITYLNISKKSWWDIKNQKTKRNLIPISDLIPSYIKFKDNNLNNLLSYINTKTINCNKPKLEYIFNFTNNKWKFALGGIHTEDSPRLIDRPKGYKFNERDVGSMYPSKIISAIHPEFKTEGLYPAHLGVEWLVGYTNNRDNRLSIKSKKNISKLELQEVEVLKLALNGGG